MGGNGGPLTPQLGTDSATMRSKAKLKILGVMTGTSCDGLDAACISIDPEGWDIIWEASTQYPLSLKKRVLEFQKTGSRHNIHNLLKLHRDLGLWYGQSLKKLITKHSIKPDLIANHGQTVAHFPGLQNQGTTLQLGDPTRIVAATGLTVISHFREGDMAAGGQGAPLVPLYHRILGQSLDPHSAGVAFHNLGGISNLTYIGPKNLLLAFDTGPGNLWIDAAAERITRGKMKMDKGGTLSKQGQVDQRAVGEILKHPFFRKPVPKSTGRDDFPIDYFFSKTNVRGPSLVRTAVEITVETIARAYETWIFKRKMPLKKIFLCGGGANNLTLVNSLQTRLPGVSVENLSKYGMNSQYTEAQAFAILGFKSLFGDPLGGAWTGAKKFGAPGQITPGENWKEVVKLLSQFKT
jgi:anhydro-N-acetylmuramic acid kinase